MHEDELPLIGGHACDCAATPAPLVWAPQSSEPGAACLLPRWDALRFCSLLAARRILFVGDSTMQQVASVAIAQVLWDYLGAKTKHAWPANNTTRAHAAGSCAGQLLFGHSDSLYSRGSSSKAEPRGAGPSSLSSHHRRLDPHHGHATDSMEDSMEDRMKILEEGRGRPWTEWVAMTQPHIVILSAGPHLYGRATFSALLRYAHAHLRVHTRWVHQNLLITLACAWPNAQSCREGCIGTTQRRGFILGHAARRRMCA